MGVMVGVVRGDDVTVAALPIVTYCVRNILRSVWERWSGRSGLQGPLQPWQVLQKQNAARNLRTVGPWHRMCAMRGAMYGGDVNARMGVLSVDTRGFRLN